MSVPIRPLVADDVDAVHSLTRQLGYQIGPSIVAASLAAIAENPAAIALGAQSEGRIIGWIHAFETTTIQAGTFVEIGGLVVGEHDRRSGVGAALVREVRSWAAERRHSCVRVRSNSTRTATHEFYLRIGFDLEKTSSTFACPIP